MKSPDVRGLIRTPGGESTAEIADPDRGETEENDHGGQLPEVDSGMSELDSIEYPAFWL